MFKASKDYSLYIFDLDGTLYDQPRLRMQMALKLMSYYIMHINRIGELSALMKFRKMKDSWSENDEPKAAYDTKEDEAENIEKLYGIALLDAKICCRLSDKLKKKPESIYPIVRRWIYEEPLNELIKAKDVKLSECIKELRDKGKKVCILSDYPVDDKLEALGIEADACYTGADKRIGELKPSPKGIKVILDDFDVKKEDAYVIGDRMEKDGEAAKAAGVDYLILPRRVKRRDPYYE